MGSWVPPNQRASRTSKIGFALSKRPHLHRAYSLGAPYQFSVTVCITFFPFAFLAAGVPLLSSSAPLFLGGRPRPFPAPPFSAAA